MIVTIAVDAWGLLWWLVLSHYALHDGLFSCSAWLCLLLSFNSKKVERSPCPFYAQHQVERGYKKSISELLHSLEMEAKIYQLL